MSLSSLYVPCVYPVPHLARHHPADVTIYRVVYNDGQLTKTFPYLHEAHKYMASVANSGVIERPVLELCGVPDDLEDNDE